MSWNRWNARRDATEKGIVDALEAVGALVQRHDAFDLLVFYKPSQRLTMLDVKTSRGRLTRNQEQMIANGWPLQIVASIDEALQQACDLPRVSRGGGGSPRQAGRTLARCEMERSTCR